MRKTVLALATFGAIGAACSFAFAGSATIPAPGPNYSPIEKGRLWRTGPALPMGNDVGLRPRWLLVRSLRRPLLVASLALLAACSAV